MNHTISDRFSRRAPQCGFLLVIVYLLITSVTSAVQFQPNDEVRLTRDAPLLFLDKPLRQGTTGETFKVLAYQPEKKKVFLAVKDPAGKEIAVSVAEESVSLVPADKAKVQADLLAAVSHQQYAVARNLLDQALRASPEDTGLRSTSIALDAVIRTKQLLSESVAVEKTVDSDLKRRRWNAKVTDRQNLLDPSDSSGAQRARQIRSEADKLEAQSEGTVRSAQANYDAAMAALQTIAGQMSPTSTPVVATTVVTQLPGRYPPHGSEAFSSGKLKDHPNLSPREAKLPENEMSGPQAEARKQYPDLSNPESPLTKAFARLYSETRKNGSALYGDPRWPLVLALCAQNELESKKRYEAIKEPGDPEFTPNKYSPDGNFSFGSELQKLSKRSGEPTDIVIVRKLRPDKFPSISVGDGELYQFEFYGALSVLPAALLVSTSTTFTSAGVAHVNLLPVATLEVEDANGFSKEVRVYRQGSSEDNDKDFYAIKAAELIQHQLYPPKQ